MRHKTTIPGGRPQGAQATRSGTLEEMDRPPIVPRALHVLFFCSGARSLIWQVIWGLLALDGGMGV
jgi:hypothetical protein